MSTRKISINKDISIAKTLTSDFYHSDYYFDKSISNIFKPSWQLITHRNSLYNSTIFPFTFLDGSVNEPALLSAKNKAIYAFSNVCTHRGNILCDEQNNCKHIQCKYHGRTFNLNGKIKSAPGFEGVKNFPTAKDNLKKLYLKEWKNFIFVSLKPNISFKEVFDDIENRLGWFPFNRLKFDNNNSNIYYINAHWALYCENYLEGFHVPYIHKGLNKEISHSSYKTKLLRNSVLQYAYSNHPSESLAIPKKYKDYNKNIYAYYYWLFPNLMLNFYSWGLSINIIEPIGKNKTKIRFLSYPIDNNKQFQNLDSSISQIEKEDQEIVLKVQKGIKSMFYNNGRYSVKHEKGIHHFHRLLCAYLN